MAEAIAVLGTISACTDIVKTIIAATSYARKHVHSSSTIKRELIPLLGQLVAYQGLIEGIKCEAELDEADQTRLSILSHVDGPLAACGNAVKAIHERLENLPERPILGRIIDSRTKEALESLDQLKPILELSLRADQRTLTKAIEGYVRSIHREVSTLHVEYTKHAASVDADIAKTQQSLKDSAMQNQAQLKEAEKKQLFAWVSTVDPWRNFCAAMKALRSRMTYGRWLLEDETFRSWMKGQSSCLWLKGSSGTGKTVLTSIVIDHLKKMTSPDSQSQLLAYFFFDFSDLELQQSESMVRSILLQLARQDERVFNRLSTIYNDQQNRKESSDPVVWQEELLMALNDKLAESNCWIVIDGLDVCSDHENLIELVEQLTSTGPLHRWFFASQPAALIDLKHDCTFSEVEIRKETVDRDIHMYVNARLDENIRLRRLSDEKKSIIKQALADKSDGMFRWVQCQLDTLCELRDHRLSTIRKVLDTLPETLSKTYQNILSRIPLSEDRETVMKILEFVAFSARPVSVIELAEYTIIDEDTTSLYDGERFEDFESMLSLCGSLITVRDNHVLLAHESVKEFLTSRGLGQGLNRALPSEQDIHKVICRVCLTYMKLPILTAGGAMEAGVIPNYGRLEQVKTKYPFLDYACSSWPLHLAMAGPLTDREEVDFSSALELDGRDNLWTAWLCLQEANIWHEQISLAVYLCESIILLPRRSSWSTGFWKQRQLHGATGKPIPGFADTDASFHDKGSVLVQYSLSPISFDPASQLSHPVCYHIALVLLEIALQQSLYTISVTDYSLGNHINFLKRLSRDAESRMGQTYAKAIKAALELCFETQGTRGDVDWLAKQANKRVIEPLRRSTSNRSRMTKGTIMTTMRWSDMAYNYLPHFVAKAGVGAVRELLKAGCNPGTREKPRLGPAYNAVMGKTERHTKCLRELAAYGADMNAIRRSNGRTLLHYAIEHEPWSGYSTVIYVLLTGGADPNVRDYAGDLPLLMLLMGNGPLPQEKRDALYLLLASNFTTNLNVSVAGTLDNPLHLAIRRKDAYAVDALLAKMDNVGAHVSSVLQLMHNQNGSGFTPLLLAFKVFNFAEQVNDELQIIKLLLEKGANPNDQDATQGETPLHLVIGGSKNTIALELLCRHSADPRKPNKVGKHPIDLVLKGQADNPNDQWYPFARRRLDNLLTADDYQPPELVALLAEESEREARISPRQR